MFKPQFLPLALLALVFWASPGCTSPGSAPGPEGAATNLAATGEEPAITLSPFPTPNDDPNGLNPENKPMDPGNNPPGDGDGDGDGDNEGSSSGVMIAQITKSTAIVQMQGNTSLGEDCGINQKLIPGSNDEAGKIEIWDPRNVTSCTVFFSKSFEKGPSCVISSTHEFLGVSSYPDKFTIARPDAGEIQEMQVVSYQCKPF